MRGGPPDPGAGAAGADATVEPVGPTDAVAPGELAPPLTIWSHAWRLVAMLALSAATMIQLMGTALEQHRSGLVALDLTLGAIAYVAVHWRRRRPLATAVLVLMAAFVSSMAVGPAMLVTVSLATRRRPRELMLLAGLNVVGAEVMGAVFRYDAELPFWANQLLTLAFTAAAIGWGLYLGSRRELLLTLRTRAERAEAERDLRAGKARSDERARIAREMHDVLAHRISQISMRAGALTFRTDLDADSLRTGVGDIHHQANEALADLRSVLGVLRDPASGEVAHRPQPTYDDLPALIDRARSAGVRIQLDDAVTGGPVPAPLGRTVYRIVQEGITNAARHAPNTVLDVRITGAPGSGVDVVLHNPLALVPVVPTSPGSGLGLVGLAERVELAGGHLSHGRHDRSFVVEVSLPWAH